MASAKLRRYGQGGSNHKQVREAGRPNGKSWKQYPKGFSALRRRLVTVHSPEESGTKVDY